MQTIQNVIPIQTAKSDLIPARGSINRVAMYVGALAVSIPLFAAGAVQAVVWLMSLWIGMSESMPLLFAQ